MDNTNLDNYISLEESAKYPGIKAPTLTSWIRNPKNEKFKRSEVDAWINNGKSAIVE